MQTRIRTLSSTPRPRRTQRPQSGKTFACLAIFATFALATFPRAQSAIDPSGHWQGTIHIPNQEIGVEVDLAKKPNGDAVATFTGVNITAFPLSDIVFDGAAVSFTLKVDGGGAFSGKVSGDGKTMSGEFTTNAGGYTLPFDLTRSGDAKFDPPARSPRIGKELEGKWAGTLDVNGVPMRVALTLVNQPDGSSTGSMAILDQGGVQIAVSAISQTASGVTIDVKIVNGSFSGTLNAEGTRLSGTWSQRTFEAPLNFQKQ
jgi:hypothetical protein